MARWQGRVRKEMENGEDIIAQYKRRKGIERIEEKGGKRLGKQERERIKKKSRSRKRKWTEGVGRGEDMGGVKKRHEC